MIHVPTFLDPQNQSSSEVLKKGDDVEAVVLGNRQGHQRIRSAQAIGEDLTNIDKYYKVGDLVQGKSPSSRASVRSLVCNMTSMVSSTFHSQRRSRG